MMASIPAITSWLEGMQRGFFFQRRNHREMISTPGISDSPSVASTGATSWAAVAIYIGYCLFTAVLIGVFRAPLHSPHWTVLAYYVLIGAVIFLAYEFGERLEQRNRTRYSNLPAICFLIALALPFTISWLRFNALLNLAVLAVACCVLALGLRRRLAVSWRRYSPLTMAFAAAAAGYCFITVNGMGYATVLAPENAVAGLLHIDTLYHSAIASMFREFGVPSTGLDGIPLTRYHTMSHIWLGTIAAGANQGSVAGYYLGNQIILIPALFFSVAVASRAIAGDQLSSAANLASAVLPLALLSIIGIAGGNSYLVSESYAMGLAFALLGLPYLKSISDNSTTGIPTTTILIGCLFGLLACATKVSVGEVFFAGFGYLLLRSRRLTAAQYVFLAAIGLISLWIMQAFFLPDSHVGQTRLNPFHFLRSYGTVSIVNLTAIGTGAFICAVQWSRRKNRRWCEAVIVMLFASVAPAMALQIDGASAFYFLNIGTWIAVAVIAAFIVSATDGRFATIVYATGIATAVLVMAADVQMRGSYSLFVASIEKLRVALAGDRGAPITALFSGNALNTIAEDLPRSVLGRIATNITDHGKGSIPLIVMIPSKIMESMPYPCKDAPFFVPAYTGLPMLMGLPPIARGCELGPYYGFSDYSPQSHSASDLTADEICVAALGRGFEHVLLLETLDDARVLDCNK
jgi:hypothetical protein